MNSMKNQRGRKGQPEGSKGGVESKRSGPGKIQIQNGSQSDDGMSKQAATEAPDRYPKDEF
jgi:hypothetical protein